MLVFVTGGVRSGKSSWAEKYVIEKSQYVKTIHYIATAKKTDEEMEKRIESHKLRREKSFAKWETWERSSNIEWLADHFSETDIVLLDCLTNLINNELFIGVEEGDNRWKDPNHQQFVYEKIQHGIEQIEKKSSLFVIVSNEVVYDVIHDEVLLFYMKLLGKCHQWIVKKSDIAVRMEFGLPLFMKGT